MIGTTIGERYEVTRHLGGGGMAQVYLAKDLSADRLVAVKLMNTEHLRKTRSLERFKREGRLLCKMHHPNLVSGVEMGQHDDRPYIVMDFIDGPSIAELIERRGKLSPDESLKLLLEIALALNHLYMQGAVQAHRDIKPTNILLDAGGIAKVTDFGIAKSLSEDESVTMTSSFLGSPHYMSPEQITDPRSADIRSDIYALGAVFYEMLTGEKAYPGKGTKDILDAHFELEPPRIEGSGEVIDACNHILELTLAREVCDRIQTPRELVELVAPLVSDVRVSMPRVARATMRLAAVIAALAIVSVAMVGFVAVNAGDSDGAPPQPAADPATQVSDESTGGAGTRATTSTAEPPSAEDATPTQGTGKPINNGATFRSAEDAKRAAGH